MYQTQLKKSSFLNAHNKPIKQHQINNIYNLHVITVNNLILLQ